MGFDSIPATDTDTDSPEKQEVFEKMKNRDEDLVESPFALDLVEETTAATVLTEMARFLIFVPGHASWVFVFIEMKLDAIPSGETGNARIYEGDSSNQMSGNNQVSSASWAEFSFNCDVSDVTKDQMVEFQLRGMVSAAPRVLSARINRYTIHHYTDHG